MRLSALTAVVAVVSTLCGVTAAPSAQLDRRVEVPVPSDDPFYDVPKDLSGKKPGDILKSRKVSVALSASHVQQLEAAYQVSHVTEDVDGELTATITTIMVPHNAYAKPQRILVYPAVEDSAFIGCAPSYSLRYGSKIVSLPTLGEAVFMNQALDTGHIVVTTDYEGPNSVVSVGPMSSKAILDGIRATLNFKDVVPDRTNTRFALIGYSGGAQAAAWAVQEQPNYAPEIKFVGAAIGAPPVNVSNTLQYLIRPPYDGSGDVMAALAGISNAYPDLRKWLKANLNKNGTAVFKKVQQECLLDAYVEFKGQNPWELYFKKGITNTTFFNDPKVKGVLDKLTLGQKGTPVPKIPLLLYGAVNDETTPSIDYDNYAKSLCDRGAPMVQRVRDTGASHSSLVFTGAGLALNFVENLLAGKAPTKGCTSRDTKSSLNDPINFWTFGAALFDGFKAASLFPVGPIWNNH